MIKIRGLVKKYDDHIAVDNITLDIKENEVFGLLGSNGAGKTTTIHMLATLIQPSSGTAIVNGYDVIREPAKVRSSIGIVFQAPSSDDILTGYENLQLHSLLYDVPRHTRKQRIDEVLALVGLTERKDDQVKTYSGGMRRRLEIARGLLHKPKVMFLDEPTLGLDPASRETMWKYIHQLVKEEKMTVILTTHYMEEADMLCDRIAIIDKGIIVALDTPSGLKSRLGGDIIRIKTVQSVDKLKQLDFVHKVEHDNGFLVLSVSDAKQDLPKVLRHIEAETVDFAVPTLNDVFIRLTGRNLIKEEAEGGFAERYAKYD
ncbi:MAG: ATP-binding cassette domain-containing protein [Thermoproteota archaeon]|jgi:ABC-2 type transport system ATP-binding protein|nr:ATP-binding cassette domain-containing protein [Thermoproteota archaeon]